MKMKVTVDRRLTRVFADGQIVTYFHEANAAKGVEYAKKYRDHTAWLADTKPSEEPIEVLDTRSKNTMTDDRCTRKTKIIGALSAAFVFASYLSAASVTSGPVAAWLVLTAIVTGIAGVILGGVAIFHGFGWED